MNKSAVDRLRDLPDVFTLSMLASISSVDKKHATVLLSRWVNADLVKTAGPRSGIYYNMLRTDLISDSMKGSACQIMYPSAVLSGETVLHNAGWTTQIPANISVTVLSRPTYAKLDGVEVRGRPRTWFAKMHPRILGPIEANFSTYGLRTLPPSLALADLFSSDDTWHPDEDDVEIEADEIPRVLEAFVLTGGTPPDFIQESLPRSYGG